MAKRTQIKQQPNPPASEKHGLTPVRPSSGSLQRIATPIEAAPAHVPAVAAGSPQHQRIAIRAYQLWESQGRPSGTALENWFEAEQLLGRG
jgi:hypothetical protein